MELTITKDALQKINTLNDRKKEWIHLAYDTEDCGCGG